MHLVNEPMKRQKMKTRPGEVHRNKMLFLPNEFSTNLLSFFCKWYQKNVSTKTVIGAIVGLPSYGRSILNHRLVFTATVYFTRTIYSLKSIYMLVDISTVTINSGD